MPLTSYRKFLFLTALLAVVPSSSSSAGDLYSRSECRHLVKEFFGRGTNQDRMQQFASMSTPRRYTVFQCGVHRIRPYPRYLTMSLAADEATTTLRLVDERLRSAPSKHELIGILLILHTIEAAETHDLHTESRLLERLGHLAVDATSRCRTGLSKVLYEQLIEDLAENDDGARPSAKD